MFPYKTSETIYREKSQVWNIIYNMERVKNAVSLAEVMWH